MKDYTAQCGCGFERYFQTLSEAKKESRSHVKTYSDKTHEVYIDRNIDKEIDEKFKYIVIKK